MNTRQTAIINTAKKLSLKEWEVTREYIENTHHIKAKSSSEVTSKKWMALAIGISSAISIIISLIF